MAGISASFEMNGQVYETDAETLDVLRSVVPDAHRTGDYTAVLAVMILGLHTGRIKTSDRETRA